MASMGGKRSRDYFSVDALHIHVPDIRKMSSVKDEGVLMCDCCFEGFDADKPAETLIKYNYPGVSHYKVKKLYCFKCLDHFGARQCPIVRGVPTHKKLDSKALDRIRSL